MLGYGGPPAPAPAAPAAPVGPSNWLVAAAVFGQLSQAYAGFSAARLASYEAKAHASAYGYRARMLELDRRQAEIRAESILAQGQDEVGRVGLEAGQRRAAITAATAARGVEAGVGTAAEVQASERLIQQIEAYHINLGAVRAANAARAGATAIANEALLARTSAGNLRRSARAARPETALVAGLGEAGLLGYQLANYRRS